MRSEAGSDPLTPLRQLDPRGLVLVSAGEASGDLHASGLIRELRYVSKDLIFIGMGGPFMEREGVRLLIDYSKVSVVGITEVLPRLRELLKAHRLLRRVLRELRPRLLILVDFPDFNMALMREAKKWGTKVFYLIPPQIWAWRKGRVKRLKDCADRVAVILPFEEGILRSEGVKATYVGHPLAGLYPQEGPSPYSDPILAILPGSRCQEVRRNLPYMWEAALRLRKEFPSIKVRISLAPSIPESLIISITGPLPGWGDLSNNLRECLRDASLCVAVSGTVTLEAALMGVPMVVVYRVNFISFMVARILARVKYISLVNLILGRAVVPELIQYNVTAERIYTEMKRILTDSRQRARMIEDLSGLKEALRPPGGGLPLKKAAELCMELLGGY